MNLVYGILGIIGVIGSTHVLANPLPAKDSQSTPALTQKTTPDVAPVEKGRLNGKAFFEARTTAEMDVILGPLNGPVILSFPSKDRDTHLPNLRFLAIANEYKNQATRLINDQKWEDAFHVAIQILKMATALRATQTPTGLLNGEHLRTDAADFFHKIQKRTTAGQKNQFILQIRAFQQPSEPLLRPARPQLAAMGRLEALTKQMGHNDLLLGNPGPSLNPPPPPPKTENLRWKNAVKPYHWHFPGHRHHRRQRGRHLASLCDCYDRQLPRQEGLRL